MIHVDALDDPPARALFGPGGMLAVTTSTVRGWDVPVFEHRARSTIELFLNGAAAFGDRPLVVSGDLRRGHPEQAERIARMATVLADRYGVGRGDRVAILAANHPDWITTSYATQALGGIVAALNGWWTTDEIRHGIDLSRPTVVVGDARRLERLPTGLDVAVLDLADLEPLLAGADPIDLTAVAVDEDDPALILFTSGTTGRSKGALNSHRGLVGFVHTTLANAALRGARLAASGVTVPPPAGPPTILLTSPFFHVSGGLAGILLNSAIGGTLVLRDGRFDPGDVLRLIEEERVTNWSPMGDMGIRVLEHPDLATRDLSSLRGIGLGGAPVSPDMLARLRALVPDATLSVGMGYGSSESCAVATSIDDLGLRDHPTSCGTPIPTVAVELRGPDGTPVPDGELGEVYVRSAYTMLGYFDDPAATEATIGADGWLAMGDLGRFIDGYLHLDSRARDLILRNAENIYPIEVEHRLDAHPAVREVAVFGVEHDAWGQEVCAVVVLESGATTTTEELAAWTGETLAPYKVPTRWIVRPEPLPRTATGKVVKRELQPAD